MVRPQKIGKKFYLVDINSGEVLIRDLYHCNLMINGYYRLMFQDKKENLCDLNGNIVFKENVDRVFGIENDGSMRIRFSKDDWGIMKNGNIIFRMRNVLEIKKPQDNFFIISFRKENAEISDREYNYIDQNGNIISKNENFDIAYKFIGNYAVVGKIRNSKVNYDLIKSDGTLFFNWKYRFIRISNTLTREGYSFGILENKKIIAFFEDGDCYEIDDLKEISKAIEKKKTKDDIINLFR